MCDHERRNGIAAALGLAIVSVAFGAAAALAADRKVLFENFTSST